MSKHVVRTTLAALALGLLGVMGPVAPASAATPTLLYSCSGPGFGVGAYDFTAVVDSDVPAAVPYGPDRATGWTVHLVAPDSFRQWAVDQGFTTLAAGARLAPSVDNVPLTDTAYASAAVTSVPTTSGSWDWGTASTGVFTTKLPASAVGHHVLTTTLEVTVAFQKNGVNAWATSATCTLDASVPPADAVVDQYDVVAATTTTGLTVKGDVATATVTSNGAPPSGTVTFSVSSTTVTMNLVSGKASATLPVLPPGGYQVSAQFVPTQPTQETGSTGYATYLAPRIATSTAAAARYRPARDLVKARAVVSTEGFDVSGRVTFVLKHNGVTLHNVTVDLNSVHVAKKTFRHITAPGRYVVIARYVSNETYRPSSDRATFRVRR